MRGEANFRILAKIMDDCTVNGQGGIIDPAAKIFLAKMTP
jgi:hypothetical protein